MTQLLDDSATLNQLSDLGIPVPHIEFIRIVVPGICEVRNTRTNSSHLFKGWVDLDDLFNPDTTPDGEWIEVFLEHGETDNLDAAFLEAELREWLIKLPA